MRAAERDAACRRRQVEDHIASLHDLAAALRHAQVAGPRAGNDDAVVGHTPATQRLYETRSYEPGSARHEYTATRYGLGSHFSKTLRMVVPSMCCRRPRKMTPDLICCQRWAGRRPLSNPYTAPWCRRRFVRRTPWRG